MNEQSFRDETVAFQLEVRALMPFDQEERRRGSASKNKTFLCVFVKKY